MTTNDFISKMTTNDFISKMTTNDFISKMTTNDLISKISSALIFDIAVNYLCNYRDICNFLSVKKIFWVLKPEIMDYIAKRNKSGGYEFMEKTVFQLTKFCQHFHFQNDFVYFQNDFVLEKFENFKEPITGNIENYLIYLIGILTETEKYFYDNLKPYTIRQIIDCLIDNPFAIRTLYKIGYTIDYSVLDMITLLTFSKRNNFTDLVIEYNPTYLRKDKQTLMDLLLFKFLSNYAKYKYDKFNPKRNVEYDSIFCISIELQKAFEQHYYYKILRDKGIILKHLLEFYEMVKYEKLENIHRIIEKDNLNVCL